MAARVTGGATSPGASDGKSRTTGAAAVRGAKKAATKSAKKSAVKGGTETRTARKGKVAAAVSAAVKGGRAAKKAKKAVAKAAKAAVGGRAAEREVEDAGIVAASVYRPLCSTVFTFRNLGPITKETDLELGDLTVIAGGNNSGKTYLTYALYGALMVLKAIIPYDVLTNRWGIPRFLGWFDRFMIRGKKFEVSPSLFEVSPSLRDSESANNGSTTYTAKYNDVADYAGIFMNRRLSALARAGLDEYFSVPRGFFANAVITGRFEDERTLEQEFGGDSIVSAVRAVPNNSFELTVRDDVFARIMSGSGKKDANGLVRALMIMMFIRHACDLDFFGISSERFGISLFSKELDFTKSMLVEKLQELATRRDVTKGDFLWLGDQGARYAKPIRDNISYFQNLENEQKKIGELANDELFDGIVGMMDAYYVYANNGVQFVSDKKKAGAFAIPLYSASSSARGLCDLYFYLRHSARRGQLLFMDEPEAHLDTAHQILMARLLARCVRAGIRVVITTHSDYIVKEFNNLIMLSKDFDNKPAFLKKFGYSRDDSLDKERVKAYVCANGTLSECEVNEYGAKYDHFDKTIDEINKASTWLAYNVGE